MNFFANRKSSRHGAILPLLAFLLPVLLVFVGFAVDVAHMQSSRLELRIATDSAARAAANTLARTDKKTQARNKAKNVAKKHTVAGEPLLLDNSNFVFGQSRPDANGRWVFVPGAEPANAVQVEASRRNSNANGSKAVKLFFGNLIGTPDFEPVQTATASFLNVDVCIVLDRSSSMKLDVDSDEQGMSMGDARFCQTPGNNSRWIALDDAIHIFTSALRDSTADEQVAMVTYASSQVDDGSTYCGGSNNASELNHQLSSDLDAIDNTIETLTTTLWNGNTHIEHGMRTGLTELQSGRGRTHAEQIMIVLTDGRENRGSAVAAASDAAAARVVVHTITFGDFADQDAMRGVASAGRGQHHHASDQAELESVFRELAAQLSKLTD